MQRDATTTQRRAWGSALTIVLVLLTIGCSVNVGYSGRRDESLFGRTPATFAAACEAFSGSLQEVENDSGQIARLSCAAPNGDTIDCDWETERCITECESSMEECSALANLAYELPRQRQAGTATPSSPAAGSDRAAPGGESSGAHPAERVSIL